MAKHPKARQSARKLALSSTVPHRCSLCGFSLHVQACHIRPVASFPEGTNPSVINADSNLCLLCPNCHFSYDNHYITTRPPSIAELGLTMHKPVIVKSAKATPGRAGHNKLLSRIRIK